MSNLDLIARIRQRTGLLTVAETAELLSVSEDTVRRAITRGGLRAIRIASVVRIDPTDLAAWLAGADATKASEGITAENSGGADEGTEI